jgi:hypothetical protein
MGDQPPGRFDVVAGKIRGRYVGTGRGRGGVKNRIITAGECISRRKIATQELEVSRRPDQRLPLPVGSDDVETAAGEVGGDVAPERAGRTGYQDAHGGSLGGASAAPR